MALNLSIDSSQIESAQETLLRFWGQFEWVAARAMTNSAKAAKAAVERDIYPLIQGGPTAWTRRGLQVRFATRDDLTVWVGFQQGDGTLPGQDLGPLRLKSAGVPSGRYMEINARGGDRRPKATELRLRRAGILRDDQYITPGPGIKLDAKGNVPASTYTQILSRLRAMQAEGSSQDAPVSAGSRGRSKRKRQVADYFVMRTLGGTPSRWQLGADATSIAMRTGPGPKGGTGIGSHQRGRPQTVGYKRGYIPALFIVEHPNYQRRFPIDDVAAKGFAAAFPTEFSKAFEAEQEQQWKRQGI